MNRYDDTGHNGSRRVVDFPISESLEAQAARWLAVLDSDNPPQQKITEFKEWINQSYAHRAAFEALLSLWDEMNILTQSVPPRRKEGYRLSFAGTWSRRIAACLPLIMLTVLTLALVVTPAPQTSVYATNVGEQKTVELPDGTTVLLNTDTWMKVAYDDAVRSVKLDRGEALFQIAKDTRRPFEVYAGNGTIRALGTAFTVHLRDARVEVLVTEGVVEIEQHQTRQVATKVIAPEVSDPLSRETLMPALIPSSKKVATQATAGTRAVFGREEFDAVELANVELLRMEAQLAWRHGVLAFDQEPLENVVSEMARYTSLKLVIPDKRVREMRVGGVFKLGDTEAMLEALYQGFGIHPTRVSEDLVYLMAPDIN